MGNTCSSCVTSNVRWTDNQNNPSHAYWSISDLAPYQIRCGNVTTQWNGTGKETIDKPTYTVDTNVNPAAGAYYWYMRQVMPDHAGSKKWGSLLHYFGPDSTATGPDGSLWTTKQSRDKICPSSWTAHPGDSALGGLTCDEYAMASTRESGGFPGGVNEVTGGDECAQILRTNWGTGAPTSASSLIPAPP
ncbi:hypothetical protein ACFV9P_03895 [Streptomyces sp. NPDC059892]|uniref:hypothetical protein n=1 Tax=Streptomyces sp. NPDC059892 TaxID=3346989 RepID=UPI0036659E15